MDNTLVNRINMIVLYNMRYTGKEKLYASAITPLDLKRIFWEHFKKTCNNEDEEKSFIKGAKLIDFNLLFKLIKNIDTDLKEDKNG